MEKKIQDQILEDEKEIMTLFRQKTEGKDKSYEIALILSMKSMIDNYLDYYVKENPQAAELIEKTTLDMKEKYREIGEKF